MNRIKPLFQTRKSHEPLLNIYFTAGHPRPETTADIIRFLEKSGADLVEIGMPYSDPLADGPTIQASSKIALEGGMTMERLFSELSEVRKTVVLPLILMGYFNPVMQFGVEKFCREAARVGIDGLILPDLPLDFFEKHYRSTFKKFGLENIFLVTPQTPEDRIRRIDAASDSFIYVVSSASTTGAKKGLTEAQLAYFERLKDLKLRNPLLAGFGISDRESFEKVGATLDGAIVGSAFVKALENENWTLEERVRLFVESIKPKKTSN